MLSLAATAVTAPTAQENQAYITALVGTNDSGTVSPRVAALSQRLTAELNAGVSRGQVTLQLLASAPARSVQVSTLYTNLLHRSPTARELAAGLASVQSTGDARALEVAILGSAEYYRARGQGTRAGFVTALFQDVLGRAPGAAELSREILALARGTSTTTLARGVLSSREATTRLIVAAESQPDVPALTPTARDYADMARPGGLIYVTARALASDTLFQVLVTPPAPASATQLPAYPIAPGFDLTSSVQRLNESSSYLYLSLRSVSAGNDDTPWFASPRGLAIYNLQAGTTTSVPGTENATSVAALSATEAFAITNPTGNAIQILHIVNGSVVSVPDLPNGETPVQVAASPDGTLWVLAASGTLYAYSAGSTTTSAAVHASATTTPTWTPISTNGYTLESISVGSATNIWALSTTNQALQYTPANGFQPDSFLGTSATAIQATSDGAVWASASGFVVMKPSWGVWKPAPVQPSNLSEVFFAAGSMNRAIQVGLTTVNKQTVAEAVMISIGLVDRQPVPYPTFTGNAQLAYVIISQDVNAPADGIRALYDTPGIDWGTLENNIEKTVAPPDLASVWGGVEQELLTEIGYVSQVYGRLDLMQSLYTQIQGINDGQLNAAGQAAGLIVNGQNSQSIIAVVLEDLFEAVIASVSNAGLSPAAAVAASILSSGINDGINAYLNQNHDTPGQAVKVAFSDLQQALDGIYTTGIESINSDISTIVQDYGKVKTLSDAVTSGLWPWVNTSSNDFINAVTHSYGVQFYQVLTAAGWQVIYTRYGDYINYPFTQLVHLPSYDIYQVPLGYELGMPIEEVYYMNQLGATNELNPYVGPYPGAPLIDGLYNLGSTSYNDFWTGENGWSVIKHIKAKV